MNGGVPKPRLQFSLMNLAIVIALMNVWLAMVYYGGQLAIILSSSLVGLLFLLMGIAYQFRTLSILGGILLLVGPFLLGLVAAMLNP